MAEHPYEGTCPESQFSAHVASWGEYHNSLRVVKGRLPSAGESDYVISGIWDFLRALNHSPCTDSAHSFHHSGLINMVPISRSYFLMRALSDYFPS